MHDQDIGIRSLHFKGGTIAPFKLRSFGGWYKSLKEKLNSARPILAGKLITVVLNRHESLGKPRRGICRAL
jgi:hypothetical protein